MLKPVQINGAEGRQVVEQIRKRGEEKDKRVDAQVAEIIQQVKENGDTAVKDYTERFDGTAPSKVELNRQDMQELAKSCDAEFIAALQRAAENIRDFHRRQEQQSWLTTRENGVMMGQRVRGLHRVGLYVPGGTAAYPSSVLMNAIPAKIAGVGELIMATPPQKDGNPNPQIMAAALIAGVDRIFLMGGAQAVAALAYGTDTVPRVDKIVGPGNIYVATAKKQLYGVVDIDMIAGPSEILVIADDTANSAFVAADFLSQAEHDVLASSILITPSLRLAEETIKEVQNQLVNLSRRDIAVRSLIDYGTVLVCKDMDEAVEFANLLAPEHLEVCCDNPMEYLGRLDNAGSVFLGHYSPEPLGDYYAGPNHVLPTSGTARFFSPLSVDSFLKKSSFIYYTKEALKEAAPDVIRLAQAEGLTAHANSIEVRMKQDVSAE